VSSSVLQNPKATVQPLLSKQANPAGQSQSGKLVEVSRLRSTSAKRANSSHSSWLFLSAIHLEFCESKVQPLLPAFTPIQSKEGNVEKIHSPVPVNVPAAAPVVNDAILQPLLNKNVKVIPLYNATLVKVGLSR